jgi:hypothetical protein
MLESIQKVKADLKLRHYWFANEGIKKFRALEYAAY